MEVRNDNVFNTLEYLSDRLHKIEKLVESLDEDINTIKTNIEVLRTRVAIGASIGGTILLAIIQIYLSK